jgi:hypothetical protein
MCALNSSSYGGGGCYDGCCCDEAEVRRWWRRVGPLDMIKHGARVLPLVPALTDTVQLTWWQAAVIASVEAPSLTTMTKTLAHNSAFLLPLRGLFVESFSRVGSYSRIIATLFVLSHCLFSKPSIPPNLTPSCLFLPVIT